MIRTLRAFLLLISCADVIVRNLFLSPVIFCSNRFFAWCSTTMLLKVCNMEKRFLWIVFIIKCHKASISMSLAGSQSMEKYYVSTTERSSAILTLWQIDIFTKFNLWLNNNKTIDSFSSFSDRVTCVHHAFVTAFMHLPNLHTHKSYEKPKCSRIEKISMEMKSIFKLNWNSFSEIWWIKDEYWLIL